MAAFPTTVKPIYGMTKRSQPNITTIRFADGFEQRQLIGIAAHQNPKIYNLTFANITEAESDEITYFLNERALDQASFTFTPEGETSTKTGTYSQSGTTITVSITAHQLFANDSISVALLPAVITKVFASVKETTENVPSDAVPEVKSTLIESLANN